MLTYKKWTLKSSFNLLDSIEKVYIWSRVLVSSLISNLAQVIIINSIFLLAYKFINVIISSPQNFALFSNKYILIWLNSP
jgi:hypothetical protein